MLMSEKPLPSTPTLLVALSTLQPQYNFSSARKTPVTEASRSLMARVRNGALSKQALGFLPGTRSSSQEFAGQPPSLCSTRISSRLSGTGDTQLPSPLLLLTLEGNFSWCQKALAAMVLWALGRAPAGTGSADLRPPPPLGAWWNKGTPAKSLA